MGKDIEKIMQEYNNALHDQIIDYPILEEEAGQVVDRKCPYGYVSRYGAIGDGITDDTSAIQNAIEIVSALGGGTVYLCRGTYLISSTLSTEENINITGDAKFSTILKLANNANCDILNITRGRGCIISNITFDGNRDNQTEDHYGISITMGNRSLDGLIIDNCMVQYIKGTGIHADHGWMYKVTNCNIYYCTGNGIQVNGTDNIFSNININGCKKWGMYIYGGSNTLINNIKAIFNGQTSVDDSGGLYLRAYRCQISNFECQENYGHGAKFEYVHDSIINIILNCCN